VAPPATPTIPAFRSRRPLAMLPAGVRVSVGASAQVHGDGDYGFVPMVIGFARAKGVSAYIGDGLTAGPRAPARCAPGLPPGHWRRAPRSPLSRHRRRGLPFATSPR